MKPLLIFGSSGHAKTVIDCVELQNEYRIIGLIDSFRTIGEKTLEYPVLGTEADVLKILTEFNINDFFIAIGDNHSRQLFAINTITAHPDFQAANIIHPTASISRHAKLGRGILVAAGAVVNAGAVVEDFAVINTNASLDHDSFLGKYSSLAPGVTVGGSSRIGSCTAICIGSTVSHRVMIGDNVVLGANSLALKDIPSNTVSYGCPAKTIRFRNPSDRYV